MTRYFKCKLLSDIVLNSSLATEGNLKSLDYIPGSNFLGIVAKEYEKLAEENLAFDIFHSGKVSFGDALISKDDKLSYAMPFSLFMDKLENKITENTAWVHHGISEFDKITDEKGNKRQLKQHRSGFLNTDNKYIKSVEKDFSLKSAYDAEKRTSADGKMFGFEGIKKGQCFIFSVISDDEKLVEKVTTLLEGKKHIGKSKTAQYGLIDIKAIENIKPFDSQEIKDNKLVIYAESNLCFFNDGQASFQPYVKSFGLKSGEISWEDSQIRTYSYSPWNAHRNSPNTQRDVILKGSVIVVKNAEIEELKEQVGEYNSEGLGRVIYNPNFLNYDKKGIWELKIEKYDKSEKEKCLENDAEKKVQAQITITSDLGKLLLSKAKTENKELEIGQAILSVFKSEDGEKLLKKNKSNKFYITKSQWGAIRTKATNAEDIESLITELFINTDKEKGYLMHGVAAERIWDKNNGEMRDALKSIIEKKENRNLGTTFVAKFASEISKKQDVKTTTK